MANMAAKLKFDAGLEQLDMIITAADFFNQKRCPVGWRLRFQLRLWKSSWNG